MSRRPLILPRPRLSIPALLACAASAMLGAVVGSGLRPAAARAGAQTGGHAAAPAGSQGPDPGGPALPSGLRGRPPAQGHARVVAGRLPLLQAGQRRPQPVRPLRRHRPRCPADRDRVPGQRRHLPEDAGRGAASTGTTTSTRWTPGCSRASRRPARTRRRRWRSSGRSGARCTTRGPRAGTIPAARRGCTGRSPARRPSSSRPMPSCPPS